jgi:phenylalanyl-tRNA synthetase beta chain
MKISLQWLGDFVSGPLDAHAVADALTNGGLPVESIEQANDDTVIDVEVTSNRGDCLSHIGVAREVAALMNREFRAAEAAVDEASTPADSVTKVRIDALDLCPHYTARVLRNVTIRPSPPWMSRRLEAVGLRPINNIVDVTNYVMFELGQPLHAFDFDRLQGRQIVVRRAKPGEKLISIDGHDRRLTPDMLAIADAREAVALAGVMGGRDSEVSNSTRNVLLESARFDPLSVRRTARALAMKSDSSYRFERRIDPTLPPRASLRAAQLMLQTAGGELLAGIVEAGSGAVPEKRIVLRLARLNSLLGIDIPPQDAVDALHRLQIHAELQDGTICASIPSWRLDLNVEADLIEEVARVIGYDRIPVRDDIAIRLTPVDPADKSVALIRTTLAAAGYFEAITVTFVSDLLLHDFRPPEAAGLARADPMTRRAEAHLRPSMAPGLLEAVRRNESSGTPGARLFEIGSTFWLDAMGNVIERRRLGLAGGEDLRDLRGAVELLLKRLDATRPIHIEPDQRPGYARGACGRIEWGGKVVGFLGMVDPAVMSKLDLRRSVCAAELEVADLVAGAQHVPQLRPLPRFPAVRRDLSLIVSESTKYQQVEAMVRELRLEHLEESEYVTTYRGKPLEMGTKSVTITLVFRSAVETLTSEQVEASVQRVVDSARRSLGATLRS